MNIYKFFLIALTGAFGFWLAIEGSPIGTFLFAAWIGWVTMKLLI